MSIKRLILIPIFVMVLAVAGSAHANVELISFEARLNSATDSVGLRWRTGSEESTASFFVVRADSEEAVRGLTNLSDAITVILDGDEVTRVPARGSVSLGARYEVIDEEVEPEETYFYMLLEIESSGTIRAQDSDIVSVTISGDDGGGIGVGGNPPTATATQAPTATATQQAGSAPTATQQATSAAATATAEPATTATAEPTATATAQPTATDEPQPTATQQPTNTPPPTRTPLPQPTATSAAQDATEVVAQVPPTEEAGTSDGNGGLLAQPVAAQEDEEYPVPTLVPPPINEGQQGYEIPTVDAAAYPLDSETSFDSVIPINPIDDSSNNSTLPTQPSTVGNADRDNIVIGGDDQLPPPIGAEQIVVEEGPDRLLWGVFIGGMLIFAAGVIGAIMIFTRQRG